MNMEDQRVASAGPEAPEMNLFQRAMLAFMAPSKLGEYLRIRQPWFWTLAIIAVVSTVLFFLIPADIFQAATEQSMRGRSQGQQMDMESAVKMARIFGTIAVGLGTFVGAWVIAGVVYLAFNVMLGGDSTYKQHLSAVSHMYWINLLGFLVVLPLWIVKEDMTTRLGLGLLLTDAPTTFPAHLMNSINLFGLWAVAVLGAIESGLSGGRVSAGKGFGTVLALYLIWAVISAASATMFGG